MSNISKLQEAIYSNLNTLQDLYKKAEGLHGLIEKVDNSELRSEFDQDYNNVIKTLEEHIDTTDVLIKALKKVLDD